MNWQQILNQLFTNLHQQQFDHAKGLRCSACGITLGEVFEVGKLGCPHCYEAFSTVLRRIVDQMNSKHVGKRPKSGEIRSLEDEMTTAALEGRFEDVESIRERIKGLRGT